MVFQAVAEYRTQVKDRDNFNLEVELAVRGRKRNDKWTIKKNNVHLTRSGKVSISSKLFKMFPAQYFN